MNDDLKLLLAPADDGRAFTEAVLLRAAGALHRRRAAGAAGTVAWTWLEAWARPWVVAAIILLALALALPVGRAAVGGSSSTPTLASDLMGTSPGTSYVLAETLGN
ncbi:MAG TPA: hypothetical protein VMT77_11845 [Gemmatimonadales bacterium]|nr:hypothetical protein [Gemmatimonadales bacterium]